MVEAIKLSKHFQSCCEQWYNPNMDHDATNLEKARQMDSADAEEYLLTMERSRRFRETRAGISLEQLEKWMLERQEDPDSKCPTADHIPLS